MATDSARWNQIFRDKLEELAGMWELPPEVRADLRNLIAAYVVTALCDDRKEYPGVFADVETVSMQSRPSIGVRYNISLSSPDAAAGTLPTHPRVRIIPA